MSFLLVVKIARSLRRQKQKKNGKLLGVLWAAQLLVQFVYKAVIIYDNLCRRGRKENISAAVGTWTKKTTHGVCMYTPCTEDAHLSL